jgi:hypothetical protein
MCAQELKSQVDTAMEQTKSVAGKTRDMAELLHKVRTSESRDTALA